MFNIFLYNNTKRDNPYRIKQKLFLFVLAYKSVN